MSRTSGAQTEKSMIKIVYFDEDSASDYLDVSAGGKEVSTSEKVKERSRETHSTVEAGLMAKLSWLPFLGTSAEISAGAGMAAAGKSILSKTLSNTILTDYLVAAKDDIRINRLEGLRMTAPKDSMAFMKMYTPYMIIAKTEDQGIDLARMDEALMAAKGYYELVGENLSTREKCILRFNIRAFRNSYGLTDLGRMQLVFHGVRVGKATEDGLDMNTEMSQISEPALLSALEIVNGTISVDEGLLDVYDVILAGIEYAG